VTLNPGERLVVDASVAVKWVVPEIGSDRAELLLDHTLVAPDLLFTECANVLWKKLRRGELTEEEAGIAARTLEQVDLTVVPTKGYFARALAIASELDHPAYDGIYLAVAEAFGLRLVTADNRLIGKARQLPERFGHLLAALTEIT
jgi:predicted nucleic acid-binding protein